jgi:hypothetical protein
VYGGFARSVVKERGPGKGCGERLEAKAHFARRLIIGFAGAETNHPSPRRAGFEL